MSIDTVYTVSGTSVQKVSGNSVQTGCEKYGRTPESVIYDSGLSLSAKAIYALSFPPRLPGKCREMRPTAHRTQEGSQQRDREFGSARTARARPH